MSWSSCDSSACTLCHSDGSSGDLTSLPALLTRPYRNFRCQGTRTSAPQGLDGCQGSRFAGRCCEAASNNSEMTTSQGRRVAGELGRLSHFGGRKRSSPHNWGRPALHTVHECPSDVGVAHEDGETGCARLREITSGALEVFPSSCP